MIALYVCVDLCIAAEVNSYADERLLRELGKTTLPLGTILNTHAHTISAPSSVHLCRNSLWFDSTGKSGIEENSSEKITSISDVQRLFEAKPNLIHFDDLHCAPLASCNELR